MNIYLIQDYDGSQCWAAETMSDAVDFAYAAYLRENCIEGEDDRQHFESCLESCTLIGELGNIPGRPEACVIPDHDGRSTE